MSHVLDVTLLVLDMHDFDVILDMDLLDANHASIDCSSKEVAFNSPTKTNFKYKWVGTLVVPKVISTWSILDSMLDTTKTEVSLTLEPMVWDYLDVFSNELLGLPPHKEIDFAIQMEPSTHPISKAS